MNKITEIKTDQFNIPDYKFDTEDLNKEMQINELKTCMD